MSGYIPDSAKQKIRNYIGPGTDARRVGDRDDIRELVVVLRTPEHILLQHDNGPMVSVRVKRGVVASVEIIEGEPAKRLGLAYQAQGKQLSEWDLLPMEGPLPARTYGEALLYLRIRKAQVVDMRRLEHQGKSILQFKVLHDGVEKRFDFPVQHVDDDPLHLGGTVPSKILGPVDFLLFASRVEGSLPPSGAGLTQADLERLLQDLELAAEAVDEAAKFIPRRADSIPRDALLTSPAQWLYDKEPDRFTRGRLVKKSLDLRNRVVGLQKIVSMGS
jgi:hypothetical protein